MECHSSHALCQQEFVDFRPRRLLYIDPRKDSQIMRIDEDLRGRQVSWAALSYVWGGPQLFRTTVSSLASMKTGFAINCLPRTLQDAVTVCKAMSLEYLWVDSLCIIQDDPDDLVQELASMPQIYQRAWVTISASTAASVSDGFLQNRCYSHSSGTCQTRVPISLPYVANDGSTTGKITFVHLSDACSLEEAEPINQRAWTYQERRLSPRLLDFRYNQVVLYCYTDKQCQGEGSNALWSHEDTDSKEEEQLYRPCLNDQSLPAWHGIVNDYANRKLSLPSDKLTALSALADLHKQSTNYTYLAGLWKETLISDLRWSNVTQHLYSRPKEYRAPSWSWASIELDSGGKLYKRPDRNKGCTNSLLYKSDPVDRCEDVVRVLNVTLIQDPPNTTYGKIKAGTLELEALALWTRWKYDESTLFLDSERYVTPLWDAIEHDRIDVHELDGFPVLVVLLGHSRWWRHGCGLILVQASTGVHRRVGSFHDFQYKSSSGIYHGRFLRGFQVQTVTII